MKKERVVQYDIIKVIAMLFVFLGHGIELSIAGERVLEINNFPYANYVNRNILYLRVFHIKMSYYAHRKAPKHQLYTILSTLSTFLSVSDNGKM